MFAHSREVKRGVARGRGLVEVYDLAGVVFGELLRGDGFSRGVRILAARLRLVRSQPRAFLDGDDPVPGVPYEHARRGRVPGHRRYVHGGKTRVGAERGVDAFGGEERLDDRGGPALRGEVQRSGAGRVDGARVRAGDL